MENLQTIDFIMQTETDVWDGGGWGKSGSVSGSIPIKPSHLYHFYQNHLGKYTAKTIRWPESRLLAE